MAEPTAPVPVSAPAAATAPPGARPPAAPPADPAHSHDNTRRREATAGRPPNLKEIEALRDGRFGPGKPGGVSLDYNLATGETHVVYVDGDGKEVGREPWVPDADATHPAGSPPAGPVTPTAPGHTPTPPTPEAEPPRGRRDRP